LRRVLDREVELCFHKVVPVARRLNGHSVRGPRATEAVPFVPRLGDRPTTGAVGSRTDRPTLELLPSREGESNGEHRVLDG